MNPSIDSQVSLLNYLVAEKGYRSYLEIGSGRGRTLRQVTAQLRVGVDPQSGHPHRMTSEEYFANSATTFDLIFIDGLHHRDQVLRDVRHALERLNPGGCIVLHDCLPKAEIQQMVPSRSRCWTGDVWKAAAEIRTWQHIDLAVLDADWGLGVLFQRPNSRPLATLPELSWGTYIAEKEHLLRIVDSEGIRRFIAGPGPVPEPPVVLEIPPHIPENATYTHFLLRSLRASGLVRLIAADLPVIDSGRKWRRNFNFARMEGVLFGIDTWDLARPSGHGHELFHSLDLLLKIEYTPAPVWRRLEQQYGLIVSPWTMFGYNDFPARYFDWSSRPHDLLYAFSGNEYARRERWFRHMRRRGWPVCFGQSRDEYLDLIQRMRWGVVLQGCRGRSCDGKNRREHAYTSCGMPLALNYIPHYPFLMEPDRDFVYLRAPADLDRLADIDPAPYAEASRRLWSSHFSPQGMALTLIELVRACHSRRTSTV